MGQRCFRSQEKVFDAFSAYCTDLRLADRVSFMIDSPSILSNPWEVEFPITVLHYFATATSSYAELTFEQLCVAADSFLTPDFAEARSKIQNAQISDILNFLEVCEDFRDREWWQAFFQHVAETRLGVSARWVG